MAEENPGLTAVWMEPALLHPYRLDSSFYGTLYVRNERAIRSANCRFAQLGSLARRIFKGAFYVVQAEYTDAGVPFLRTLDIKSGFVETEKCVFLSPSVHVREKRTEVAPRDLLLAKTGASIGYSAVVPDWLLAANICQDLVGLKPDGEANPYYLSVFISSVFGQRQADRWRQGNAHPHLGLDGIREWLIAVPSCDVQTAIGNKLRYAERLKGTARDCERETSQLLASVLSCPENAGRDAREYWVSSRDLAPYRINPTEYQPYALNAEKSLLAEFKAVPLKQAIQKPTDISNGATPKGGHYVSEGIGFLRVQNVLPNRLDTSDMVFIDEATDIELKRSRIRANDVVLTITGYPGTACCIQEDDLPLNMNQHCVRFHLKDEWNPHFVAAFLNSTWGKVQVQRRAIGGTRDALDYPSVLSILLPIIDRDVQERVGSLSRNYARAQKRIAELSAEAKRDVEALVNGTLNTDKLLKEGEETAKWLEANPIPAVPLGVK